MNIRSGRPTKLWVVCAAAVPILATYASAKNPGDLTGGRGLSLSRPHIGQNLRDLAAENGGSYVH
jgi:hypothetical protein